MILFEINHPAHIHLFRNLSQELLQRGIASLFMIKSDPVIKRLADHYDLPVIKMGKKGKGLFQKYLFQLRFLWKSVRLARKTKAGIGMGVSMNLPMVSRFSEMQSIGLDDDDMNVTPTFAKYANRADIILTPSALGHENRGEHHITYPGYHELAYLHPKRFIPDPEVLKIIGVGPNETYFVLRFNAFAAHHDIGEEGMSFEQKKILIEKLQNKGKVFISSEGAVDPGFRDLLLPDKPELMHSILAHATMYVGESQTMTSEAAILGTPALKCNSFAKRLSIPNELEEKYELCYSYKPLEFNDMLGKVDELLTRSNLKAEWQRRREIMLKERIDVTAFLSWFVTEYPNSIKMVKEAGDSFFKQWL